LNKFGRYGLDNKKIKCIGVILIVGGIMLSIDGVGSILVEFNTHSFWSDVEKLFRAIGGILLAILGIYMCKNTN
jgi:putative Mn2+ efflux pump MntP